MRAGNRRVDARKSAVVTCRRAPFALARDRPLLLRVRRRGRLVREVPLPARRILFPEIGVRGAAMHLRRLVLRGCARVPILRVRRRGRLVREVPLPARRILFPEIGVRGAAMHLRRLVLRGCARVPTTPEDLEAPLLSVVPVKVRRVPGAGLHPMRVLRLSSAS